MTNELADLEQTKMEKREQRAMRRRELAEAFSGSLVDTLKWVAIFLVALIMAVGALSGIVGTILLADYLNKAYGTIGLLLQFLAEGVLAFIIIVICRTVYRVRK